MKLDTERDAVRTVAARWRAQYPPDYTPSHRRDFLDTPEVQASLDALDPETATALDVANIIGNASWVRPTACHACGTEAWNSVGFKSRDSRTFYVCGGCLKKALTLIASKQENEST